MARDKKIPSRTPLLRSIKLPRRHLDPPADQHIVSKQDLTTTRTPYVPVSESVVGMRSGTAARQRLETPRLTQ